MLTRELYEKLYPLIVKGVSNSFLAVSTANDPYRLCPTYKEIDILGIIMITFNETCYDMQTVFYE